MITKEHLQEVRNELGMLRGPILPEQLPRLKVDTTGLIQYAKEHNKQVIELDDEEKAMFVNSY